MNETMNERYKENERQQIFNDTPAWKTNQLLDVKQK